MGEREKEEGGEKARGVFGERRRGVGRTRGTEEEGGEGDRVGGRVRMQGAFSPFLPVGKD